MHNRTGTVIENCVIVILAILGETMFAAFFATLKIFVSKVPPARPLRPISPGRTHISDLGRGDTICRIRTCGVFFLNCLFLADLSEGTEWSNVHPLLVLSD